MIRWTGDWKEASPPSQGPQNELSMIYETQQTIVNVEKLTHEHLVQRHFIFAYVTFFK